MFLKYPYFKNNLVQDNYWVLETYVTLLTLLGTLCMPGTVSKCFVNTDSLNRVIPFEEGIYDDCGTRIIGDEGGSHIWNWAIRSLYSICSSYQANQ